MVGFAVFEFVYGVCEVLGALIMTDGDVMDVQHVVVYLLMALVGVMVMPPAVVVGPLVVLEVFGSGDVIKK